MYIYCFQAYYWGGADRQIQEILRIISGFNFLFDQHVYRLTGASPEQALVVGTA